MMPVTDERGATSRVSRVRVGTGLRHMYGVLAGAVRPRPLLRVSDWADAHRMLSSKASALPGRWRTERTPYLRDVMDDLSVTSPVQRVVMRFAAQLGKTEVGLNWIGYVMAHAPGPMLVVVPTLEVRKRWKGQRLDPLLSETPALRDLLGSRRTRDAAHSEDLIDFPGGVLVLGGANSPASLASMPIRYVLCDEVDRFPWEVGQEGDPLGLIDERTKAFVRRKVLLVSTPTVDGASRIDAEYEASDQREYHVPCPHCGEHQVLRWQHEDGRFGLLHLEATDRVVYVCIHCGAHIEEHHKPRMLSLGRWVPKFAGRPVHGYTLSGLYSPLGMGFGWAEIWHQWQAAQGDTAKLKRFCNTTLGQAWREQGESLEEVSLLALREDFPDALPVLARTAFVDVQKDRLEMTVIDWGAQEEAWVFDHIILPGDTAMDTVWADLADEVEGLQIDALGVDAGYNAPQVHAFVAQRRWAFATKGMPGMQRSIVEDARARAQRLRKRRKGGTVVHPIGVDSAKALVFARIKQTVANVGKGGPGCIHWPKKQAFDDEYFAQIASEKLVTKYRGTRPVQEWVQVRARNEALDCMVGNLAVLRLGVDLAARAARAARGEPVRRDAPSTQPGAAAPQAVAPAVTPQPTAPRPASVGPVRRIRGRS